MSTARLRVGVLLDSTTVPRWIERILEGLRASEVATLELVVVRGGGRPPRAGSGRVARRLFALYEGADAGFFRAPNDHAAPVEAEPHLLGAKRLHVTPAARGEWEELAPPDVDAIRDQGLDVLVQLGFGRLRGDVLEAARWGLWTFAHEEAARVGAPPFFWEMALEQPLTETALVRIVPGGGPPVPVYRSFGATDLTSLDRGRNAARWKSTAFVERALRRLALEGELAPAEALLGPAPALPARAPSALEVARFGARLVRRVARNRVQLRRYEHPWLVAVRRARSDALEFEALSGFEEVPAPPDRFWADPCVVHAGGQHYLFFEDGDIASEKGRVCALSIAPDGTRSEPWIVLERDYHLSYPYLFAWRDAWWMLAETSENRTVELYRAVDFPRRFELERVLFQDVVAVDPTLIEHGGRFWLFLAMSAAGGPVNDELFLFHADSPLGGWRPHPQNPVVSDVRRARPAGRPFRRDGVLLRPGQDCSAAYGGAIWVCRIDALDERTYRETPIAHLLPNWLPGLTATHALSRDGDWEAIDGRRLVPRRGSAPQRA